MPSDSDSPTIRKSGLAADVAEMERVALRDRWGLGLVAVGWVHLALFLVCQGLFSQGDRAKSHFLPLWGVDLVLATLIFRRFLKGPDKKVSDTLLSGRAPALLPLVIRVWITFLILAFSSASLNSLTGFETDWFKASWSTLATFGFATMAWVFHLAFLIPAVQMSLTALMIARYPEWAYLIYGVSWCLALNGVGLVLERRRALAGLGHEAPLPHPGTVNRSVEVV
jgi:hypothetical protein